MFDVTNVQVGEWMWRTVSHVVKAVFRQGFLPYFFLVWKTVVVTFQKELKKLAVTGGIKYVKLGWTRYPVIAYKIQVQWPYTRMCGGLFLAVWEGVGSRGKYIIFALIFFGNLVISDWTPGNYTQMHVYAHKYTLISFADPYITLSMGISY